MRQRSTRRIQQLSGVVIPVLILPLGTVGRALAQGGGAKIAITARSLPDEAPETFLRRAYPGGRVALDPRFSTGSGVFRAYFVDLPDGRCVRAELETQFSTLPGRGKPSAILELNEKPLPSPLTWKIAANAVGPIRLGMKAAAARETCAVYPVNAVSTASTRATQTTTQRTLVVSYFGKRLLAAHFSEDKVTRIEVTDPHLKTDLGIGPGASLAEAARHYGAGAVLLSGDGLCLTFDAKCPGRGFLVARPQGMPEPSWSGLLKTDPRVRAVIVAGSPDAFAAETRAAGLPRATQSRVGESPAEFVKRAFPGCKTSAAPGPAGAGGARSYLVQLPDGSVQRAELAPASGANRGVYTLSTAEVRSPFKWQASTGALGPVRLGMKAAQVAEACAPYAVSLTPGTVTSETESTRGLVITHFGKRLAELELSGGKVSGIRVLDTRWSTPQRVGVGSPLRELVRLYGNGELIIDESEIWVVFDRTCPGRSFLLSHPVPEDDGKPLWPVLVKANPRVKTLRVGTP